MHEIRTERSVKRNNQAIALRQEIKGLTTVACQIAIAEMPNPVTIAMAQKLLETAIQKDGVLPTQFSPCDDGGVTVLFAAGTASAVVEFYNSGEIVVAKAGGPDAAIAEEWFADDSLSFRLIDDLTAFLSAHIS